MTFSQLIGQLPFDYTLCGQDRAADEPHHISNDSRLVRAGSIFVCIRGAVADGHRYARAAYDNGCRLFAAQQPLALPADAAVLITEDTRTALARMAARLYSEPSRELQIVGITGTKGKTTTARMIAHVLNSCGIPTGYIGTSGVDYADYHFATVNTTPESCDIQRYLRDMVSAGMRVCVMEVSSQALKLSRVLGVRFDICLFTNLSRDHIGGIEHPDMADYMACKARLFRDFPARLAIYNADDPHAQDIVGEADAPRVRFGLHHAGEFTADGLTLLREAGKPALRFVMRTVRGETEVTLPFPGAFSVYNALGAAAVCHAFGLTDGQIAAALGTVAIEGRFETVCMPGGITAVIDYAHNGVSLRSALETLRQYRPRRLICLFGSVGGRTQMRRAELGAVAAELADLCILTSDNPDNEPPMDIIRDIASQFGAGACPHVDIPDREEAICYALSVAREGDILLLAGKGHEKYQLIAGQHVPFCERDILTREAVRMALAER